MRVAIDGEIQPLIYKAPRHVWQRAPRFSSRTPDVPEAPALGGDPGIEHRAARDLEAFEQFAGEQRGEFFLPFDAQLPDAMFGRS